MVVFAYGFRIFFLAASLLGALGAAAWSAALFGARLRGIHAGWHAHEMVFGFGGAIVTGFLLTATPNWTKTAPRRGPILVALAVAWALGRLAPFVPSPLAEAAHGVGAAQLLVLAAWVAHVIVGARSHRNYGVVAVVVVFAAAAALSHAAQAGLTPWPFVSPTRIGADALVVLMAVVGGRITPLFTKNALGEGAAVRDRGRVDDVALAALALALLAWHLPLPTLVVGPLWLVAGVLQAWRMRGWGGLSTLRSPLLWVLHVGYVWIAFGLVVGGVSLLLPAWAPPSAAHHAFTAGAIGTYGLGMMARVSLGHTGRPLVAPAIAVAAFWGLPAFGLLRVLGPTVAAWAGGEAGWVAPTLGVAAAAWAVAYGAFGVAYAPVLLRPRADGRPG